MAWLGKVSLAGFPDLAGAVTKLSESVKTIEKNFDSALGLEEKPDSGEASGIWPSAPDRKSLLEPVMAFMGQKGGDDNVDEPSERVESSDHPSSTKPDVHPAEGPPVSDSEKYVPAEKKKKESENKEEVGGSCGTEITSGPPLKPGEAKDEGELYPSHAEGGFSLDVTQQIMDPLLPFQQEEYTRVGPNDNLQSEESKLMISGSIEQIESSALPTPNELHLVGDSQSQENKDKQALETEQPIENGSSELSNELDSSRQISLEIGTSDSKDEVAAGQHSKDNLDNLTSSLSSGEVLVRASEYVNHDMDSSIKSAEVDYQTKHFETYIKEQSFRSGVNEPGFADPGCELEKVKKEMKLMEAALQGAARQAQAKADEIAKLMNENEQLKSTIEDLKRKSTEAEMDALREDYRQRVASLERKVYVLTRERDTLRREQNKKSDAAALLKEKDEIISQVMAEGEELSKKQAAQESTIRKLRAQIREFEEEKQRFNSKLQVEEMKVESIKRDKAATEQLLQETMEKNQIELAAQKEFYTNALSAAKEAEALAETRANKEARIELECHLREADEREHELVRSIEMLRQTLGSTQQEAAFREDMLRRDIDELQKRYQASELRYSELIAQVPESTRPLLRQIEAMQETAARKAEAWNGIEKSLNARLEAAEAIASAAEERERFMNERLSQTLSRTTVLETQIARLRTEQRQLRRSLEKERQRASESRQEYLVATEEAATHEGHAKQLEDEIRELRSKHKQQLQEEIARRELIEKELEQKRTARSELERIHHETSFIEHDPANKQIRPYVENGNVSIRKLSSAGSLSSMEESFLPQAYLDSDSVHSERRIRGETTMSPYFLKSMTPNAFEATLRQKDGELVSYISRLALLESIRDSLAVELVKMTTECEKLQAEVAVLPGIRAELEALRRRHSSALELMGERDEEREELRADITDLKEMYREQVDLLVRKIQMLSAAGAA